jgi:hypothetical protein
MDNNEYCVADGNQVFILNKIDKVLGINNIKKTHTIFLAHLLSDPLLKPNPVDFTQNKAPTAKKIENTGATVA